MVLFNQIQENNHHYLFGHLNTASFQLTLNEFAKELEISKENPILLVLNGTGAHRAKS